MKSNVEQLVKMYQPLPFFQHEPYAIKSSSSVSFSLDQKSYAQNYLAESLATLEHLCSQISLKVHQILITCQEILEMAMAIPSIVKGDRDIDMREALGEFPALLRLATLLDVYYNNPVTITQGMIRQDCEKLAAHM